MYLKHVQSLTLDFIFYIIQRLNTLIKSIACYITYVWTCCHYVSHPSLQNFEIFLVHVVI
jgi:hypothetical protein